MTGTGGRYYVPTASTVRPTVDGYPFWILALIRPLATLNPTT